MILTTVRMLVSTCVSSKLVFLLKLSPNVLLDCLSSARLKFTTGASTLNPLILFVSTTKGQDNSFSLLSFPNWVHYCRVSNYFDLVLQDVSVYVVSIEFH